MQRQSTRQILTAVAAIAAGSLSFAQIGFAPAVSIPTGLRPNGVAVGDFDGDGDRDVAVTTDQPDKVEIQLNDGAGGFVPGQVLLLGAGVGAAGLAAGDFDGDGDVDLAVSLHNQNSVRLLLNAGNAIFALGGSAAVGTDPRELRAGDVDADGDLDLVTSNRNGNTISIVLNAAGVLGPVNTVAAGNEPRGLALADLNGDGRADIAVAAHDDRNVNVFLSLGGGAVSGPTSLSVGPTLRPSDVTAADLDGDGDRDLAAATDDNDPSLATTFRNLGGGAFSGATTYFLGGLNPSAIVAADFDLDGDQDLATANDGSANVSTIANAGNATFAGPLQFGAGISPDHMVAADLDGNGSPDLVVSNRDSNTLSVLLNTLQGGGATPYCIGAPNSAGPGASMSHSGSRSIAANTFTLIANGAIPNQPGLFFYGAGQARVPFGNGFRCIATPIFRLLPPAPANAAGTASRLLNFGAPPASSGPGQITAGSTWNFQFWYRDPAAGGSNFNLSNGLSVGFLP